MSSIKAPSGVDATIVITTKDRKEALRTAVESALEQTADAEVLVVDDGSSDGTAAMIREEYPCVRLHREETSAGLIVRRNQAAQLANGSIIFSIDDDAEFSTPYVVEQTLDDFTDPCIGAVAIPYVDVQKGPTIKQQAPDDERVFCTAAYRGTAHALRRDVFLQLGGYREHYVHQGEEMDYCIRMLDAGYAVRLGTADVIHHHESPHRSFERMDYYGRRNEILFHWQNTPQPYLPVYLATGIVNTIRTALPRGRYEHFLRGMGAGYRDCFTYRDKRDPVEEATFDLYQKLRRKGPMLLSEVDLKTTVGAQ